VLASSARVTGLLREAGRVVGVQVRDLEGGADLEIRAQQVVNCTGVWTDEIQDKAGRGRIHVRASKGVHLVVPRDRIQADSGMILRTEKSVLFIIPWAATGSSGRPTPTGTCTRRTRRPTPPTSTTCWST
jgi:glycerol-3-phosphate dehydrogenase